MESTRLHRLAGRLDSRKIDLIDKRENTTLDCAAKSPPQEASNKNLSTAGWMAMGGDLSMDEVDGVDEIDKELMELLNLMDQTW